MVAPDPRLPSGRLGRDEEGFVARPERGRRDDGRRDRRLLPLRLLPLHRGFRACLDDRPAVQGRGGDGVTAETNVNAPEAPKVKNWYIVHTYSGFEERVRQNLSQRVEAMGMKEHFGDIRIPTETLVEMKGGKRREVQRKFFPGYII